MSDSDSDEVPLASISKTVPNNNQKVKLSQDDSDLSARGSESEEEPLCKLKKHKVTKKNFKETDGSSDEDDNGDADESVEKIPSKESQVSEHESSTEEEKEIVEDTKVSSELKLAISDSSSSDSGVDDPFPINNDNKKRKRSSEEKAKPNKGKRKKSTEQKSSGENSKILSLKKYIRACGMHINNYNKLFEGCKSMKAKEKKLMSILEDAGIKGRPTLEKCKSIRLKREEEQEIADLNMDNIIKGEGSRKRLTRSQMTVSQRKAPQIKQEYSFSNLADIVSSGNSGDDSEEETKKPKRSRIVSSSSDEEESKSQKSEDSNSEQAGSEINVQSNEEECQDSD